MGTQDPIIKDSIIHSSAVLYKSTRITKSRIDANCSIGDNTSVLKSSISESVIINRNCAIDSGIIGFGSYLNQNTIVKNAEIGKFCCISWNVTIYGESKHNYRTPSMYTSYHWNHVFHPEKAPKPSQEAQLKLKTVIGNDVWIGNGAILINGIHIGDGAVIGAGAVVTKDVEPYTVVVGVPAQPIKKRFDEKTIGRLLSIKWWDWPKDIIGKNESLLRIEDLTEENLCKLESIAQSITKDVDF